MNETRNTENLPPIPMSDPFKYKHYIVMKQSSRSYTLFLWTYELTDLVRTPSGSILAFRSGELALHTIRTYTYQTGQANWVYKSSSTSFKYSNFNDMIYNNFAFNLEHMLNASNSTNQYYECTPMPGDLVKPAVEPDIPKIPTLDNFQFKHYNIVQHKQNLEQFFLFLWEYEPDTLTTDDHESFIFCNQKYGRPNDYRLYQYNVGNESKWAAAKTHYYLEFGTFDLVYNNYHMDWGKGSREINPLPDDQVIPAPKLSLPEIPDIHNFQYKHYCVIQDKSRLNRYTMCLLQYEPVSFEIDYIDRVVAYQKYGQAITCQVYDFQLGQNVWTARYRPSSYHLEEYDYFEDAVVYSNFTVSLQEQHFEINPFDNDGVSAAPEAKIPSIPNLDNFFYKHYYIVQDRNQHEKYHLTLLKYEPASTEGDDERYFKVMQKYGKSINYKRYTYTVGQDNWNDYSPSYYLDINEDLSQTLVYHNFAIDINGKIYQINPLPDDKVVPALKPEFPRIPYENDFQYKHYFIFQDKTRLEKHVLYLYQYEPACVGLDNSGNLVVYNQYGKKISRRRYDFDIGKSGWEFSSHDQFLRNYYEDYRDALVYNNFALETYDEYHQDNCLPDDRVVPAIEPVIPPLITNPGDDKVHYIVIRNPIDLDSYTLCTFLSKPHDVRKTNNGIEFVGENNKIMYFTRLTYRAGDEEWVRQSSKYQLSNDEINAIEYCNFDLVSSEGAIGKIPCNTYTNDGLGIRKVRNGWTEVAKKWYYYVNGKRQFGWIKEKQSRAAQTEQISYCGKALNGARAENGVYSIDGSRYLFQANGLLVTGKGNFEYVRFNTFFEYIIYTDGKIYGQEFVFKECYTKSDLDVMESFPFMCYGETIGKIEKGTKVKLWWDFTKEQCYINTIDSYYDFTRPYIKIEYGNKYGYLDLAELVRFTSTLDHSNDFKTKKYVVKDGISEMKVSPDGIMMMILSEGDKVNVVVPEEKKTDGGISWIKVFYYSGFRWVPEDDIREWTWDDQYELRKLKADTILYNDLGDEQHNFLKGTVVTVVKGLKMTDLDTSEGVIPLVVAINYEKSSYWIDARNLGEQVSEGSGESYSEEYTYTDKDGNTVSKIWNISNDDFINSTELSQKEVTDICQAKNPGLVTRGFDTAIHEFAKNKGINSKIVLATLAQEQGWCKNGKYEKAFGVGEGGNPIDFAEGSKGGLGLAIDTFLKLFNEGLSKENGGGLTALLVNHDPSPYKETKAVFGSSTAQWQANNPKYVSYMEKGQNIVPVNSAMYAKLRYTPWVDFPPQGSYPLDTWLSIYNSF